MTTPPEVRELILQVVRGERPWRELGQTGIKVALKETEHGQLEGEIENPNELEAVADARDLAQGLWAYRNDPTELRSWAFVLEAGSFVDFDLNGQPTGDLLLEALWDASFGNPIDPQALQSAQELLAEQPTH